MKTTRLVFSLILFTLLLTACSNMPVVPTKTPTMSPEEMMQSAQETAEALRRETETQWAIDNPSPTPTETATPTPEYTPTSAIPVIPPTATEPPRPYLSVGYISHTVYKIGDPGDYHFYPRDNLYVEVCYTNEGSGTWNENYYCLVSNQKGSNVQPSEPVYLGKEVSTGQKACFSFTRVGSTDVALRSYCSSFQLYTDTGAAVRNGYDSVCYTIE